MRHCLGSMAIKKFPLRGQGDTPVGTKKKRTAQRLLQQVNGPGHIGLTAVQSRRSLGQIPVFGGVVKHPVVVKRDIHRAFSISY